MDSFSFDASDFNVNNPPAVVETEYASVYDLNDTEGVSLTPYARLLCEIDDTKRDLGADIHKILGNLSASEWARVRSYFAQFARVEVVPHPSWTFVEQANRGRAEVKSKNVEWSSVTVAQLSKTLPLYPELLFDVQGVKTAKGHLSRVSPMIVANLPGISGGFAVYDNPTAEAIAAAAICQDWMKSNVVLPKHEKFANGIVFPVTSSMIGKLRKYLNDRADPVKLLDSHRKASDERKVLTKFTEALSHPDCVNGLIQHGTKNASWQAPSSEEYKLAMRNAITRALPLLKECRTYRGVDNTDFERSIWYVHALTPRAVADVINYQTMIGDCKAVTFDNGPSEIEKYFAGIPKSTGTKMIIFHERSYVGKFNPSVAAERLSPELTAWKVLETSVPKEIGVVLSMMIPTEVSAIAPIITAIQQGWEFFPGVAPHNGRFWLARNVKTPFPKGTSLVRLLYWIQLGIVVNYVRTLAYVSLLPGYALQMRDYLKVLYQQFAIEGKLHSAGEIMQDDFDAMNFEFGDLKRDRDE